MKLDRIPELDPVQHIECILFIWILEEFGSVLQSTRGRGDSSFKET